MTDLQLEVNHCHAVCAELRTELDKAKADKLALELELQAVIERSEIMSGQVQELIQTRHNLGNQLFAANEQSAKNAEIADCLFKAILLAEKQGLTAAELRSAINMVAK